MAASIFDPSSLLDAPVGDLNTRLTPVDEGEYYAKIKSATAEKIVSNKDGREFYKATFVFIVDDEEVRQKLHMAEPQVRMQIFLDIENGRLVTKEENPNANVKLGQLKEALGFKPGKQVTIRGMEGFYCYIKVRHRTDPNDIDVTYAEVVSVSAAPTAKKP